MTTIAPKTAGMAIAPAGGQLKTEKDRAQKAQRVMRIVTMMVFIVAMMMVTVFATGAAATGVAATGTITKGVQDGMTNIFKVLRYISYGVGVVSLAVAGFKLVLGGQKGMETAKTDVIRIILFAMIVLLAPTIVSSIFKWFGKGDAAMDNPITAPTIG